MATSVQQHLYQCEQCGAPKIVAAPILYQQGTRTFSGILNHGVSQSVSAGAMAPPRPRGYVRQVSIWGFIVVLCSVLGYTSLYAFLTHKSISASLGVVTVAFLILWIVSIRGMVRALRGILRYNREVYPKLQSEWTHTYMCQRCGKLSLIV